MIALNDETAGRDLNKAARCGEPSYVWRAGQERRLRLILEAAGDRIRGDVLDNGCGIGMYVEKIALQGGDVVGLEYDSQRASQALQHSEKIVCAAGEHLPFPNQKFDLILSHEVLEHVQDDLASVQEMIRTLKPGGRMVIFAPNRGYPFETHGIYWKGKYIFGNIPLVNYLPRKMRDRLAPHVRIYSGSDLEKLFIGQPVRFVMKTVLFGAYDNIIARWPKFGRALRSVLKALEISPLQFFGLSHFWVVEKI